MKKLSKSACEKWLQCPFSYDAYYNQRLEPARIGSSLVFGNGVDKAIGAVLTKKSWREEYQKEFDKIPLGEMIVHPSDYDPELLSDDTKAKLLEQVVALGYPGDDVDNLVSTLIDKVEPLSENQNKCLDLLARESLKVKAELFIIAHQKHVMPYIEEVFNVQKAAGPGYLDATLRWAKRGKVIADYKTSGKRYPTNAVEYSAQLAMYAAEEKITDVVYIVFIKSIKKNRQKICSVCGHNGTGKTHKTCDAKKDKTRCDGAWTETIEPEAEVQIIHGEITPRAMEVAAELQSEIARAVEAKIFPCNVQQCNSQFGKPCVYRDLKWKGDMTGLKKREYRK
jgi:hypothetical protein